jgi:hypothetical protein
VIHWLRPRTRHPGEKTDVQFACFRLEQTVLELHAGLAKRPRAVARIRIRIPHGYDNARNAGSG